MNRSNGTDHETALKMALGVLVDNMESKLAPYKDTVIVLTDDPLDDPDMELCDRLHGKWVDVCKDNMTNTWYFMWDTKIIATGYGTRDAAKAALFDHLISFGLEIPDDLMVDDSPAKTIRLTTPCIRT